MSLSRVYATSYAVTIGLRHYVTTMGCYCRCHWRVTAIVTVYRRKNMVDGDEEMAMMNGGLLESHTRWLLLRRLLRKIHWG